MFLRIFYLSDRYIKSVFKFNLPIVDRYLFSKWLFFYSTIKAPIYDYIMFHKIMVHINYDAFLVPKTVST